MKIAYLAGYNTVHTVKWVNEMAHRGHDVHLITMHSGTEKLYKKISVHNLPFKPPYGYYLNQWCLKEILNNIKPDILNTHYASGYGTLSRLSGFKPNLLSVWGSDVFDFPNTSFLHHYIVKKNLMSASRIASTSHVMKIQTEKIFKPLQEIAVTPFGVDCEKFKPFGAQKDTNLIRIGTVKRMAPKYGISTLIRAFALITEQVKENIELVLVGGGPQEEGLKLLTEKLNIRGKVKFTGPVPHSSVADWLNSFDIYAALSALDSESFGVAIIEASACGLPVVVSDAGGLPEVVKDEITGYVVPRNNPFLAAEKLILLIKDKTVREAMGKAGREFVLNNFQWNKNANYMEKLYMQVIDENISRKG